MSKPKKLKDLAALAADVERLCDRVGASRLLGELQDVAEEQERQHRAMGKRVCGATYAGSVRDAVNYFICKTVLESMPVPSDWRSFCNIRRDHQLGAACHEAIADYVYQAPGKVENGDAALEVLVSRWTDLSVDYSKDIAGRA